MTESVKKLYEAASKNLHFRNELKAAGEKAYKPSFFWCNTTKALYATIYLGWLIARGEYKESDY